MADAEAAPARKKSDLPVRAASAVVMLAVAIGALVVGGRVFDLFVAVVAFVAFAEFVLLVVKATANIPFRLAAIIAGALYFGLAAYTLIRFAEEGVAYLVGIVIFIDTFAYFAGRSIGGPKIAPSISPSKTWAGLLGGAIGAALFGFVYAYVGLAICKANLPAQPEPYFGFDGGCSLMVRPGLADIPQALLFGLFFAIVAQSGDFLESWLKRKAGVKDSSKLIPGHGGVFDRVDGLIAVAFVVGLFGSIMAN